MSVYNLQMGSTWPHPWAWTSGPWPRSIAVRAGFGQTLTQPGPSYEPYLCASLLIGLYNMKIKKVIIEQFVPVYTEIHTNMEPFLTPIRALASWFKPLVEIIRLWVWRQDTNMELTFFNVLILLHENMLGPPQNPKGETTFLNPNY